MLFFTSFPTEKRKKRKPQTYFLRKMTIKESRLVAKFLFLTRLTEWQTTSFSTIHYSRPYCFVGAILSRVVRTCLQSRVFSLVLYSNNWFLTTAGGWRSWVKRQTLTHFCKVPTAQIPILALCFYRILHLILLLQNITILRLGDSKLQMLLQSQSVNRALRTPRVPPSTGRKIKGKDDLFGEHLPVVLFQYLPRWSVSPHGTRHRVRTHSPTLEGKFAWVAVRLDDL